MHQPIQAGAGAELPHSVPNQTAQRLPSLLHARTRTQLPGLTGYTRSYAAFHVLGARYGALSG